MPGERLGYVRDRFNPVIGQNEGGETVEIRKISKFSDFVIAEIDTLEKVLSKWWYGISLHILNGCELVAPEVELPFSFGGW